MAPRTTKSALIEPTTRISELRWATCDMAEENVKEFDRVSDRVSDREQRGGHAELESVSVGEPTLQATPVNSLTGRWAVGYERAKSEGPAAHVDRPWAEWAESVRLSGDGRGRLTPSDRRHLP